MRTTEGPERDVLPGSEAVERSRCVRDVAYELDLDLGDGSAPYLGRAVVHFELEAPGSTFFLDFTGQVRSLVVNGKSVSPDQRDNRIWIAPEALASSNRLEIEYENDFDTTGAGLHRFVDPEDGQTYVYSHLEPFAAHRIYPGFDQPDIKGTYQVTVTAPSAWHVVTSMPVERTSDLPAGRRRHEFPRSPRFSSYIFPLVAGPYARVGTTQGPVPMGLFARASLRTELERDAEEIFGLTVAGMDYYADLFGRAYPFTKYDQLYVPEFNIGGMENVGTITYNDDYLFRDPPTHGQRLARADVTLHELAHMWFGDLVTMRWWDDLWLKETFATYLSSRCLTAATSFTDAWQDFSGRWMPRAYREDQLVTTHPVATPVEDTDQAQGNFDGITYMKGAAVIRQLVTTIGDDAFRAGCQAYVERHAWGNATLADFLDALSEAYGRPLDRWAELWLRTSSLNTIGVTWSASDGRIEALDVHQSAPADYPTLRPHATTLALVGESSDGGGLELRTMPVAIEGESVSVPEVVGWPAPLFVHPNQEDLDYALARLDPVSVDFALERLPEIPDPFLRQQTWSTLWAMTRNVGLRSTDYLAAVRRFAPGEADRALVESILGGGQAALRRYIPEAQHERAASDLCEAATGALRSVSDPQLRVVWARAAAAVASTANDVRVLIELIDGHWAVERFEPDQRLRWDVAIRAAAFGLEGALDRVADEEARDSSDRGQRAAIAARVSHPSPEAKAQAWERIHGPGYGSDHLTLAAIGGFQWWHQRALTRPYREPFYEGLPAEYERRDHAFAAKYLRGLMPDLWAEPSELERIRALADDLTERGDLLRRHLLEAADDLERDIRVRAFAGAEQEG